MTPFPRLTAIACPLPLASVDTDQLIPARFMRRARSEGYGGQLLHDLRFDGDGRARPDFPLNMPAYRGAEILVARRNFGAGSSREAAVYALADFGIRCVIAPSFGDIFAANCANNGVVPALVSEMDAERLLEALSPGTARLTVDLESQVILLGNEAMAFSIDPVRRVKLINGWDDLDLTRSYTDAIRAFERDDAVRRPWAPPGPG